ncbi:protein Eaa, partial [Salmonella enterica]|nr:protein Eaa [Salmonella enterica]EJJ4550829.1 protein Eaa [Salmonella enterica]EJJ4588387.1 protein Eaa [Salmonella enterica]EJX6937078.1 protein Eaa [Salmonella enterica]
MKHHQITASMAKDIAFKLGAVLDDEEAGIFADGYNVALLQSKYRDLSQPVDPQISEYEKIMLRAGWVMVPV